MSDRTHYQLMAEYSQWMNHKLYTVCAEIPDEKRKENLGAFFKSIHGTLNHILVGDRIWLGRFINQPFTATLNQELYSSFDELRQERIKTDLQILEWSKTLTHEWLNQPFTYTSGIDQKTRTLPTWVLVAHMFNHQTHHRGQLTTLLNQLGHDPGVTDIPWMPSLSGS